MYIHKAVFYRDFFVFQGTPEVDPAMSKYLAPSSPAAGTPKPVSTPAAASATQVSHMPSSIKATPEQVRFIDCNLWPNLLHLIVK